MPTGSPGGRFGGDGGGLEVGAGIRDTKGGVGMEEMRLEVLSEDPWQRAERLQELEADIRRGKEALLSAGRALWEIRERRLFAPPFEEWDDYCQKTWGWTRSYADRLISWARVEEALAPIGVSPQNEAQARELHPLMDEPEAAKEVWERVGEENNGAHPARGIREAMRELGYVPVPKEVPPGDAEALLEGYSEAVTGPHREVVDPKTYAGGGNYRVARKHRKLQKERRLAGVQPTAETGEGDVNIHNTDFELLGALVPEGGVDMVLTDPPYHTNEQIMGLWDKLGAFAAKALTPDGLLVSYMGNYEIPEAIRRVEKSVPWWWQMIVLYGGKAPAHGRGFSIDYKPVQVFSSPARGRGDALAGARPSVIGGGGKEKSHHEWQQPLAEAVHLILSFTEPGDLVADPFSGGGTVAVAAKMTGRRCVAAEIDPKAHAASIERLKGAPAAVPEEIADALRSAHPGVFAPKGEPGVTSPGGPGTVSALFGGRATKPQARAADTQERRIEGVRDALERVSAEVVVLRPRDLSESGKKLRRRRFTR